MARNSWSFQLVRITDKGFEAFQRGEPRDANPYMTGERGGNGISTPGGNLQKQRANYWDQGWQAAEQELAAD